MSGYYIDIISNQKQSIAAHRAEINQIINSFKLIP
jgi:hypothetical protein